MGSIYQKFAVVAAVATIDFTAIQVNLVQATVMVFTERAAWEKAIDSFVTEDFNSVPVGAIQQSRCFDSSGQDCQHNVGQLVIDIYGDCCNAFIMDANNGTSVDGTRHFAGAAISQKLILSPSLIFNTPITGFGADWGHTVTPFHSLNMRIDGELIRFSDYLDGKGDGFLGVVAATPFDRAKLTSGSRKVGVGGGSISFKMDNVSFTNNSSVSVPEPSSAVTVGLLGLGLLLKKKLSSKGKNEQGN